MKLQDHLNQLEAGGHLRLSTAQPELAYSFRHALTRDAAYASLLRSQRRAVHRAAAEVLEALCSTAALRAGAAPVLAEHWAEAGEPAHARDFWELAAEPALARHALPEAIAHLGRALALAPAVPNLPAARWAALYLRRGRAQYSNTEWQASWDTHTALLALGERLDDAALRLAALLELANQRAIMNPLLDPEQARALSQPALALARQLGDQAAEARALWVMMRAHSLLEGESALASAAGEQSLALARAHGLDEQAAYTLSDLQYVYRASGQNERALAVLALAREYWRTQTQQHMLADNLNQSATLALVLGDYALAEQTATEALALSLPTHNLAQTILSRTLLAQVFLDLGRFGAAWSQLDGLSLAELGWFAHPLTTIRALFWANVGRVGEATASLEPDLPDGTPAMVGTMFRYGQLSYSAYLRVHAGQLAEAQADVRAAQALPSAHEGFRFQNFGYFLPLAEAALAQAQGESAEARALYQSVIQRLTTSGPRPMAAEAEWRFGQALAAQNDPAAEAMLTQAVTTAEHFGQHRVAWQAWFALAGWQTTHGRSAAAALERARTHLLFILDGLTTPDLRGSFLNLPDVRAVLHS